MLKKIIITAIACLGLAGHHVAAEELRFPKTEAEFVDALSTGDKKGFQSNTRGLTRGMNKRGVGGITPPSTPPKVGALINFDIDSARIKPESYDLLDNLGNALNGGLSDAKIIVAGHTDSTGSATYNDQLSIRRAKSVADYLIYRHRISDARLWVQGFGESTPIADNTTAEGRALNRRVEFIRK
jgi:outer membrane protein OmpA-like peptidoglycan-associated protein